MLIDQIPFHLRNTIEYLAAPIWADLDGEDCRPPLDLALGDTLMVMGMIRNQGQPVRLHMKPHGALELIQGHPLIREVVTPQEMPTRFKLRQVASPRSGREFTWISETTHRVDLPVLPVDHIRVNPILGHSLYYGLPNLDDRPSLFVDPARPAALGGLLSSEKPNLVLYPFNPGRGEHIWQDEAWWLQLIAKLTGKWNLIAVGAEEYGAVGAACDAVLPQSDPASTLPDLAWLMSQAQGFCGRDGGLYHIAAAVCSNLALVWDSMGSYRFWAGRQGHHLIMSNPYGFRYPQTQRVALADLKSTLKHLEVRGPDGSPRNIELKEETFEDQIKEQFGDLNNFMALYTSQREAEQDKAGASLWMARPELKDPFYEQSQAFALSALNGELPPGANWVAPVVP